MILTRLTRDYPVIVIVSQKWITLKKYHSNNLEFVVIISNELSVSKAKFVYVSVF